MRLDWNGVDYSDDVAMFLHLFELRVEIVEMVRR